LRTPWHPEMYRRDVKDGGELGDIGEWGKKE